MELTKGLLGMFLVRAVDGNTAWVFPVTEKKLQTQMGKSVQRENKPKRRKKTPKP